MWVDGETEGWTGMHTWNQDACTLESPKEIDGPNIWWRLSTRWLNWETKPFVFDERIGMRQARWALMTWHSLEGQWNLAYMDTVRTKVMCIKSNGNTDLLNRQGYGEQLRSSKVETVWKRDQQTFQVSLVLTSDHHIANTMISKEQYAINNPIGHSMAISRFNLKEDAWEPYSDIKDMQLEFTMFDPHICTALPPVAGKPGIYSTQFCVPDWHGMVKFVVNYKHEGIMAVFNVWLSRWMHLHHSITVAVVPPWHDEYLRFLGAAWSYSTSVGFFLFYAMWLAGDVHQSKKSQPQKTE
ncbi:Oligosaccharyltransferase 48 kDa subunit beta-domain-containing protein [Armillaria nabsnona]|nr:Oligosaccharyltransferase 48 kDa subunit beta-domain-containing protein [Armillaria nabsnona]